MFVFGFWTPYLSLFVALVLKILMYYDRSERDRFGGLDSKHIALYISCNCWYFCVCFGAMCRCLGRQHVTWSLGKFWTHFEQHRESATSCRGFKPAFQKAWTRQNSRRLREAGSSPPSRSSWTRQHHGDLVRRDLSSLPETTNQPGIPATSVCGNKLANPKQPFLH